MIWHASKPVITVMALSPRSVIKSEFVLFFFPCNKQAHNLVDYELIIIQYMQYDVNFYCSNHRPGQCLLIVLPLTMPYCILCFRTCACWYKMICFVYQLNYYLRFLKAPV
jgi:hypothetical protein